MWRLVTDGFKEFSNELVKEAQETVIDSVKEGSSIVKEVASNVKDLNEVIRNTAAPPPATTTAAPLTGHDSRQPADRQVVQLGSSNGSLHSTMYDNDNLIDEYISESRRLSPSAALQEQLSPPPRAASAAQPAQESQDWWTDGATHSQLALVSPAKPGPPRGRTSKDPLRRSEPGAMQLRGSKVSADGTRSPQVKRLGSAVRPATAAGRKSNGIADMKPTAQAATDMASASASAQAGQAGHHGSGNAQQHDFEDLELDGEEGAQPSGPRPFSRNSDGTEQRGAALQSAGSASSFSSKGAAAVARPVNSTAVKGSSRAGPTAVEKSAGSGSGTGSGASVAQPAVDGAELHRLQQLLQTMQDDMTQLRREVAGQKERAAAAEAQAEQLQLQLQDAHARADEAHQAAATSSQDLAAERRKVQGLQLTLEAERADRGVVVAELHEELQQAKQEVGELQEQLADEDGGVASGLRTRCSELEEEVSRLKQDAEEQDAQVSQLAEELEGRLGSMQQKLADAEASCSALQAERNDLAAAKDTAEAAVKELKVLLKQSAEDRSRLASELETLEASAASSRDQVGSLSSTLERQRKEFAEVSLQLAQLKEQQEATRQEESQLGAAEREAMEVRLSALRDELVAAQEARREAQRLVEVAQQETAKAREATQAAEQERDEAIAHAQAAESIAVEERTARAEAQSSSATLRAETERRAALFHNAVRSAVEKAEARFARDSQVLQARLAEAETALQSAQHEAVECRRAMEQAQSQAAIAQEAAVEAAARAATAEQRAEQAQLACDAAVQQAAAAAAATQAAEAASSSSQQALDELQKEVEELRVSKAKSSKLEELHAEQHGKQLQDLQAQLTDWKVKAQQAMDSAAAAASRAESQVSAAAEARQQAQAARSQLLQLEQELQSARGGSVSGSAGHTKLLPTRDDILSSLGLDTLGLNALLSRHWMPGNSYNDVELGAKRTDSLGAMASSLAAGKKAGRLQLLKGVVSTRTWILIGYMVVLHVIVMAQFSRRHIDLEVACAHMHPHPMLP